MGQKKELALVTEIIERVRIKRGLEIVPTSVCSQIGLETIRKIQKQRSDLHQSGVHIDLRLLTNQVCSAQIFSIDAHQNKVLQYAYEVVAMNYFGDKKKENARREQYVRDSLASQVPEQ